jgi:hypothetical protein
MIPYDELDKALARWKARTQNATTEAAREFEASGAMPLSAANIISSRQDRTGEIELGDVESVVETYDEN